MRKPVTRTSRWWEIRRNRLPHEKGRDRCLQGVHYDPHTVRVMIAKNKTDGKKLLKHFRADQPDRTYFLCRSSEVTTIEFIDI